MTRYANPKLRLQHCLASSLLASCAWAASAAHAQEAPYSLAPMPSNGGLKISGFGTLGYFFSNGPDDLRFRRELGQNYQRVSDHPERADSRLGVQLNYQATHNLELVGQAVAREKADARVFNSVEWAFLKYTPTLSTTLRLGRVGLDTFMLADYRNVGYAYNWVRPPSEFYGWIPFYYLNGGDALHAIPMGEGLLKAKVFGGITETGMPWFDGAYKMRANTWGLGVSWETDEWRLRAYHTYLKFKDNTPFDALIPYVEGAAPYWPSAGQYLKDLTFIGQTITYDALGATWEKDGWQVASELAFTHASSTFSPQGMSAYVLVGHRFDKWVPFVSFARSWDLTSLKLDAPPPIPGMDQLGAQLQRAFNTTHTSQYTASAGVRWDFADRMALKMQWDRSVVSVDGTQMWGDGVLPWRGGSKHVWSATLDFTF